MKQLGLISLLVLVCNTSHPQTITDRDAFAAASNFCTKLRISMGAGPQVIRASRPGRNSAVVFVLDGNRRFFIDNQTQTVSMYFDSGADREVKAQNNSRPAPHSLASLVSIGKQLWLRLTPSTTYVTGTCRIRMSSSIGGKVCDVQIWESIGGVSTEGNGNSLTLSIDSSTQRVISCSFQTGYQYTPRVTILNSTQARNKATQYFHHDWPNRAETVTGIRLCYFRPTHGFQSIYDNTEKIPRKSHWAYEERFSNAVIWIDAQTGDSLGGVTTSEH